MVCFWVKMINGALPSKGDGTKNKLIISEDTLKQYNETLCL